MCVCVYTFIGGSIRSLVFGKICMQRETGKIWDWKGTHTYTHVLSHTHTHTYILCLYCCAQSLTHVWHFMSPWTVAHQALLSMGFPRQESWSGFPEWSRFLLQGIFPTQVWNPCVLYWQADSLPLSHPMWDNLSHDYTVILSKNIWFPKCTLWRSARTP